jgi:hypothetical protein
LSSSLPSKSTEDWREAIYDEGERDFKNGGISTKSSYFSELSPSVWLRVKLGMFEHGWKFTSMLLGSPLEMLLRRWF